MIRSMSIEGFRGIRALREPVTLKKFNVIIGRNNSGKSSLIESLYLFPLNYDRVFGVRREGWLVALYGSLRNLIYGYTGEARISYEADRGEFSVVIRDGGSQLYEGTATEVGGNAVVVPSEKRDELPFSTLFNGRDKVAEEVSKFVNRNWDAFVKERIHIKIVRDVIGTAIDDEYTEVLKYENDLRLRKVVDDGVLYIRLEDVGLGFRSSLLYLMLISYVRPNLVLWDDFERAMHPSLIKATLRFLAEREWQVVIATHSIDVLYYVTEVEPEDFQLLILKRSPSDEIAFRSLSLDELEELIEANVDPRKLAEVVE